MLSARFPVIVRHRVLVRFQAIPMLALCTLIAACSHTGRSYTDSQMQETLEIEILPNTSKMFVYRLRAPDNKIPGVHIERGDTMHGRPESGGVSLSRSTQQNLHENAAYVVKRMGYCREGFLEIDSSVSRYNLWIKGECKEGSTDEDIKKFGTKQTLPVKL